MRKREKIELVLCKAGSGPSITVARMALMQLQMENIQDDRYKKF